MLQLYYITQTPKGININIDLPSQQKREKQRKELFHRQGLLTS